MRCRRECEKIGELFFHFGRGPRAHPGRSLASPVWENLMRNFRLSTPYTPLAVIADLIRNLLRYWTHSCFMGLCCSTLLVRADGLSAQCVM